MRSSFTKTLNRAALFSVALVAFTSPAHSDQVPVPNSTTLMPNIAGEARGSLPQGRFMVSMLSFWTPIESRSLANGDTQTFSSLFNRGLTWQQVVNSQPDRSEQVAGLLQANGITDLNGSAGQFAGDFQGRVQTMVPLLGYGITDRIGVFFVLPILKFQTAYSMAYQSSPQAQALIKSLQDSGQNPTAQEMAQSLNQGFDLQLQKAGYAISPQAEVQKVGDLRMDVPVPLSSTTANLQFTTTSTLVIPTAQQASPTDLFVFNGGDGRFAIGQKIQAAWVPPGARRLTAIAATGGVVPLPVTRTVHVPQNINDIIPAQVDPQTLISGGASVQGYGSLQYQYTKLISSRVSYQFQHRFEKTFSGTAFDPSGYQILGSLSAETLHSLQASVDINTIQTFLEGDFLMPGILTAGVGVPLGGQNALINPTFMLQGSVFF